MTKEQLKDRMLILQVIDFTKNRIDNTETIERIFEVFINSKEYLDYQSINTDNTILTDYLKHTYGETPLCQCYDSKLNYRVSKSGELCVGCEYFIMTNGVKYPIKKTGDPTIINK